MIKKLLLVIILFANAMGLRAQGGHVSFTDFYDGTVTLNQGANISSHYAYSGASTGAAYSGINDLWKLQYGTPDPDYNTGSGNYANKWVIEVNDGGGWWVIFYNTSTSSPAPPTSGWIDVSGYGDNVSGFNLTLPSITATTSQTNVSCNGGSNGSATVTPSGGTAPYTYSWSLGGGTGATASGLAAGTYTVTVTDANSYSATKTVTITQPTAITVSASWQTNVACNGSSTGSASVTVSGGTAPYSYSWSPAGGTAATASGLSAGAYTVTITDANACTKTKSFTITQPTALTVSASSQTNVACNGSSTGSASVTVSGGTAPYSYSWSPGGGTAATATGLAAGAYTVTITDANACTKTKSFTITQPAALTVSASWQTNVACNGSSTGSASVTVSGGTAPYTYSWSPSGGTAATASGLSAGSYTVTVTDANSCSTTKNFTITQPAAITATTSQTNVSCNGGSNGTATVTPSGGTGPYTYSWSPGGGTGATASGLSAGSYTVTITDANNCTATKSITITQPAAITATTSQTNVSCNGGSNGTATVTPSGGTAPYTYSWSPGGGTGATASGLSAGSYTVTITDANSCTATKSITIAQPTAITATTLQTNVSCNGGSNGTATVTPSGGTGPYTYSWSLGGGTAATASGLSAGSYTVTITDANSCSATKSFTITQPSAITATTSQTNVSCNGGSNGTATVTPSGGTGPYSYSWSPSGGTAATASGLSAGSYTVIITDANSCTATRTFTITQPSAITASSSQTNVSCNGSSNGSASVAASGGTGPYTYSWAPSGGSAATATGLSAGTYTVTITDANSCSITRSFTITEPISITASVGESDATTYGGADGTASISVSGGTGPYTYSWAPGGGTGATAAGLTAGSYSVTVTDANSCQITRNIVVSQPAASATITSVAVPPNGYYKAGNTLTFTVNFSSAVNVTGTPYVPVTIGLAAVNAQYAGGSGTSSLTFTYTVAPGDNDSDGIAVGSTISLNGGSIKVAADNTTDASLTLNSVGSTSAVLVDTQAPVINISGPSPTIGNSGTAFSYTLTWSDANLNASSINAALLTAHLTTTGTAVVNQTTFVPGSGGNPTNVTFNNVTGDGTVSFLVPAGSATDQAGNSAAASSQANTFTVDNTPPTVVSLSQQDGNPTNETQLDYQLTFSEPVTGVDASDFTVISNGVTAGSISITPLSSTVYNISIANVSGTGSLGLNLNNTGTGIADAAGNAIGAGFTGEVLTVDQTPPEVTSIAATTPSNNSPTTATSLVYTVTFSEAVSGVDASDFTLSATNTVGATIASVAGSGTTYTVTIGSITGKGTLRLDLNSSGTGISDLAGNAISAGFSGGDLYTIGLTAAVITFNALPGKTYGDADFDPGATSTNTATAITYASDNPAVATIVSGKVHIIGAGTANITASQAGDTNYDPAVDLQQTLTVNKLSITVAADAQSKNYGDADPALTFRITSGSLAGTDTFSGALSRDAGENVGAYAIHQGSLALSSNYALAFTGANLTIGARPVTVTAVAQSKNYGDTDPTLTFRITSGSLIGTDAFSGALSRDAGENVGAYSIHQGSLALSSNYALAFTGANLTIGARPVTVAAGAQSKNYGDADPALTYRITAGGLVGTDTFSGALSRDAGENVGAYSIHQGSLALSSNYALAFTGANLTIGARPVTVAAGAQSKNYGDADPALTYRITSGSLIGTDTFSGALSRDAGENVGAYSIHQGSLALSSNYALAFTGANLTIGARPVTVAAGAQSKNYGDADPALTYRITAGSLIGTDTFSGALSRDAGENVGAYGIHQGSLALSSNYVLAFTGANLTIGARPVTVAAGAQSKNYGDADPALTYRITSGSLIGTDTFSGALSRDAGENVGTYAIKKGTLSIGDNYEVTFAGANLNINKAALTIRANDLTRTYGQANPALTVAYTGFVNGDDASKLTAQPTVTTTAAANSAVGNYLITLNGAACSNYSISYVPGTLTVEAATLTITPDNQTKIYGEANPALTAHYSGFIFGDDASKFASVPSLATTALVSSGAGDYAITAGGAVIPNYTVVYQSGVLTVNKAALTVAADNQSKAYGTANPELTIRYSGFVNGDDLSKLSSAATAATTANANTPPGTYPITVTGAASPNYTFTYVQGTLTIVPLTDASLSGLLVNQGRVILSPDFAPDVYSYSATVESQVDRVNITALFGPAATAQINGSVFYNNSPSNEILLQPGNNSINIVVTAQDGRQHTYSISIYRGLPASSITATNILTPNGDGKNDTWMVKDINLYPENMVSVYDRAGRLVYSKHGYQNDWDGTLKGSPLEQGTYFFTIDLGNGGNLIKGFITIIREQ